MTWEVLAQLLAFHSCPVQTKENRGKKAGEKTEETEERSAVGILVGMCCFAGREGPSLFSTGIRLCGDDVFSSTPPLHLQDTPFFRTAKKSDQAPKPNTPLVAACEPIGNEWSWPDHPMILRDYDDDNDDHDNLLQESVVSYISHDKCK